MIDSTPSLSGSPSSQSGDKHSPASSELKVRYLAPAPPLPASGSPATARGRRTLPLPLRGAFDLIVAFSGRRQLDRLLCSLGVSDSLAELQAFPERRVFRFCVGLWVGFGLTCDVSLFISFVKDFLERISGPGTILALKLRHPKNISAASTAFAIVQFDTQESASLVENAAQRNALRRGIFCLKVRPAERDLGTKVVFGWRVQLGWDGFDPVGPVFGLRFMRVGFSPKEVYAA